MANENPTWGYTRIRGGLKSLGHDVARNTIKAILADHGIAPAPERGTTTRWKTFLAAHWDALAAADFFTVEVLTFGGLVRYAVFFVTKLKTRTGEIAGITCEPDEAWMTQVARKLTDARDGFLHGVITWGRLVSAVVTQLARAGAPGVPSRVFYTSIPVEAMRAMNPDREPPPFLAPQASHSTVRVPFKEADLDATRRSMSCHKTQFPDGLIERMTGGMGKIFKGELPLSPMVPQPPSNDLLKTFPVQVRRFFNAFMAFISGARADDDGIGGGAIDRPNGRQSQGAVRRRQGFHHEGGRPGSRGHVRVQAHAGRPIDGGAVRHIADANFMICGMASGERG